MTISEFKNQVVAINQNESASAVVYLVFKSSEGYVIRLMDVEHECQGEIKGFYVNALLSWISQVEETHGATFEFPKLSVADDRNSPGWEYDLGLSEELQFLSDINCNGEQTKFSQDRDDISKLYGYVAVVGTSTDKMVLFKKHMQVNTFAPSKLCLFNDGTRFKRFTKTIIRFDAKCDLVLFGQTILIKNLNVLERFLGFHDVITREATQSADSPDLNTLLDGVAKIKEWIKADVSFARKLVRVQRSSPVLGRVGADKVISFIRSRSEFSSKIRIVQTGEGEKISIKSKASAVLLLKILNDDFLKSELTDLNYESKAKDRMDDGTPDSSSAHEG